MKDADVDREPEEVIRTTKRFDRLIMVVLAMALGYFAIQDEIAAALVEQLKVTLLGELPHSHTPFPMWK